jgi:hypothetical protein
MIGAATDTTEPGGIVETTIAWARSRRSSSRADRDFIERR